MFYNLSNHPSEYWGAEQLAAARQLAGEVADIPFPAVSPAATAQEVARQARDFARELSLRLMPGRDVVHVMGEMTFCFALVNELMVRGIRCVASTTDRHVTYAPGGEKLSQFAFVAFRDYVAAGG